MFVQPVRRVVRRYARGSGWRRVGVALAVGVCALVATSAASAVPTPVTTVSFTSAGCSTWAVPAGVSSVSIDAVGAAGSAYGSNSTASGLGDGVSGTVSGLTGGTSTLFVCVNQGGGTSILTFINIAGGTGGGASGVSLGSDFSQPVVVAGGGGGGGNSASGGEAGGSAGEPVAGAGDNDSGITGGGGGDNTTGSGGAGGTGFIEGSPGSAFSASGPGVGGESTGAGNPMTFPPAYVGGAGGGGYYGGGSGGYDAGTHGSGGGGGSDYCVDSGSVGSCSVSAGAGTATGAGSVAGDAQVTLTYSTPIACTAGTYSATGLAPCTPAPAGSYVSGSGATSPTLCSPGSYQSQSGQQSCAAADIGFYVSGSGKTSETQCPGGETTPTTASTSISACFGATNLTAAPELDLAHLALGVGRNVVSATLTSGGQPLAGKSISFSAGPFHLCTATTNNNGVASCRLSPDLGLLVVLVGHYSANFVGATPYLPSSASTPTAIL
jgi:hypothetical protein